MSAATDYLLLQIHSCFLAFPPLRWPLRWVISTVQSGWLTLQVFRSRASRTGFTPFYAACETGNIECAKWLIEIGGTSDILELKRLPLHAHKTFYSNVQRRIHNFTAINILLLQSQVGHRSLTPSVDRDTTSAHLQVHTPASLQGFEFALIKMIADFIDVPIPYGKPLRRLREIHDALLSLVYT